MEVMNRELFRKLLTLDSEQLAGALLAQIATLCDGDEKLIAELVDRLVAAAKPMTN